ncbi:uncharacterized protein LOC134280101 [Saccostrea cucullata]|uniref:uncharacterized protein LOC134280101 n=1 Tax=Saccostrea cuccullata TaxID=36930 RepID=UPI002ED5BA8E
MECKVQMPSQKRLKKRRAKKLAEDEQTTSDSDSPCSSKARKRHLSGSGSRRHKVETYSSSSLSSDEDENYQASNWTYEDLKYMNIFYEDKSKPIKNFVQEIKDALKENKLVWPDPSKVIDVLTKHLNELMPFSYDLASLRKWRKYGNVSAMGVELSKYEEGLVQKRSKELLQENQSYKALDPSTKEVADRVIRYLEYDVETFVDGTSQLAEKNLLENPKGLGRKARKRARGEGRVFEDSEWSKTLENQFQHYCSLFVRMFFLQKGFDMQTCFSFKKKTVRYTHDLVYHYYKELNKRGPDQLLFFIEVKNAAVSCEGATNIKELVGEKIMGQVGSALLCQSRQSLFFPNSLGIICMETKLIFVFLKISLEHWFGIHGEERSPTDPGMIMYTEPFDMLKQEDRLKMADFMFWLGFVQKRRRYFSV